MRRSKNMNFKLVESLMKSDRFGPLAEAFVLDAVGKFADKVAKSKVEEYPHNCIVHPETWIELGKEIKGKLDSHFDNLPSRH